MTASILSGSTLFSESEDDNARVRGQVTSGGSESILLAVLAAREYSFRTGKCSRLGDEARRPEIVLAPSAHAAFFKAAHYFGMRVRVAAPSPSPSSSSPSPAAAAPRLSASDVVRCLSRNTALVVASAPSFPHGIVDDVEAIARETSARGIPLVRERGRGRGRESFLFPFFLLLSREGFLLNRFSFSFSPQTLPRLFPSTTTTQKTTKARRLLPRRLRARLRERGGFVGASGAQERRRQHLHRRRRRERRHDSFFSFSFDIVNDKSGERPPPPEPPLRLLRARGHLHLGRRAQVRPVAQGHLGAAPQGVGQGRRRGAAAVGVRRHLRLGRRALRQPGGGRVEVRGAAGGGLGVDGVCREGEGACFFSPTPRERGERTKKKTKRVDVF